MTKAEERALEAYPYDYPERTGFRQGYEQAEKDLADVAQFSSGPDGFFYGKGYQQAKKDLNLTWEDMRRISRILDIMVDDDFKGEIPEEWGEEEYYEEVLRRFNEAKKGK